MHANGRRITTAAGETRRSAAVTTRSTHRFHARKAIANSDWVVVVVVAVAAPAVVFVAPPPARREDVDMASNARSGGMVST
jgi:hypothetical protein